MIWKLPYIVDFEITGDDEFNEEVEDEIYAVLCEADEYQVTEDIEDILEYLIKQKFYQDYSRDTVVYDSNIKDYIKEMNDLWFNNKLDTFKLYTDSKFIEFLKDKYRSEYEDYLECEVYEHVDFCGNVWVTAEQE